MKSFATLALVGAAAAAPHASHADFHKKDANLFAAVANLAGDAMNHADTLAQVGNNFLNLLTPLKAANSQQHGAQNYIGTATSGNYVVNTIVNNAGFDATWTCWGPGGSWVNKFAPTIAVVVPKGKNVTVSHMIGDEANKNTGGCSPVWPGDKLVNGQIFQSWMEYTFVSDQWSSSTYDLSMEVNPNGHNMTIAGDKCKASLDSCVFKCNDPNAVQCGEAGTYSLHSCSGPNTKFFNGWGVDEGGCGGIEPTGITKLTTTLH